MGQPQYLDDNGNPVGGSPTYLDDNGNPLGSSSTPVKGVPEVNIQAAPPSGAAHPINWLTNAMSDIEQGGDSTWLGKLYKAAGGQPIQAGAGGGNPSVPVNRAPLGTPAAVVGGPATGPLQVMRGQARVYSGHPVQGFNDEVQGAGKTVAPFAAMTQPEFLPVMARYGALQGVVSRTAQALGMSPDTSQAVGNAVSLGAGGVESGVRQAMASRAVPPTRAAVLDATYRSINPPVNDVEGFKANLNNQFDTVVNYARQNNLPLNTRADFNTALQGAAAADPYRAQFIKPFQNDIISPPGSYKGATTINGTRATIGQLDARLSQINDTLNPRYMKGGQGSTQAQAAIGAEQASALTSEANAIRQTLASEISKRTGADPEVIRGARKNYEQMKSLAEDVTYSLNQENHAYNTRQAEPLTLSGAKDAVMNRFPLNPRNWQANPIAAVRDRMFGAAVRNYQAAPTNPINFQPMQQAPSTRVPVWQSNPGQTVDLTTFKPLSAEEQAAANAAQRGQINYRINQNSLNSRVSQAEANANADIRQRFRAERQAELLKNEPEPRNTYNTNR